MHRSFYKRRIINNKKTEFTDFHNGSEIDFSYKTPFLSNQKIELGYDGKLIDNKNIMGFDTETIMGDGFYIDTIATNTFQFKRKIHAFFIEYEKAFILSNNSL